MMSPSSILRSGRGFTLVEMIVAIVITGIVAAIASMFIQRPVEAYLDVARRAALVDSADTALRRMARDVRLALPNSLRTTAGAGGIVALEFLPIKTGGRYRVIPNTLASTGDPLSFDVADTTFDALGPAITLAAGDQIVVYNLGIEGADAYAGNNRRAYVSAAGNTLTISSASALPFASPSHRFHVITTPVTYYCDPTGTRTLRRISGYAITAAQTLLPGGATNAILAQNVTACAFTYTPGLTQSLGLLAMQITLTDPDNGESVSLYHEVHVNNAP